MTFVTHDPRFTALHFPHARLDHLWAGGRWAEGPVWFADLDCLLFSDIPNNRMLRFCPDPMGSGGMGQVSVFRAPSQFSNGNTRDRQGRLITCEHGLRRVTRTEADGSITVIADSHGGRPLNAPNDVVVASDGSIWFTDPTYGILSDYEGFRATPQQPARHVFRVDPAGTITAVCDDFTQPNGLAFSPDERWLYVADSGASHDPHGPRHLRRFAVADGRLTGGEVLAQIAPGVPDGLRVDDQGHIWCSAADGVHCLAPDGTPLGLIAVPEPVANLTFGGPRRNRMYICATTSLYAVTLCVNGAQRP